jgi:hypothetical protein
LIYKLSTSLEPCKVLDDALDSLLTIGSICQMNEFIDCICD